jgi:hypothetical protein
MRLVIRDFKRAFQEGFLGMFYAMGTTFGIYFIFVIITALIDRNTGLDTNSYLSEIINSELFTEYSVYFWATSPILAYLATQAIIYPNSGRVAVQAYNDTRSFFEFITLNFLIGHFYRRTFYFDEIHDVRNQYTYQRKGQPDRRWEVVMSGVRRNGFSFSQRVRFSTKQARDEFRANLRRAMKEYRTSATFGGDFAY